MVRSTRSFSASAALTMSLLVYCAAASAQGSSAGSVKTEAFESWILTCVETDDSTACEINQNIADSSGRPVMQLQVGRFNEKLPNRAMLARFPVDVMTNMPITWTAGETSIALTLRACRGAVCAADGRISSELAESLLQTDPKAETLFSLTRSDGSNVAIPLSLTGFAEAWAAMVERTRE